MLQMGAAACACSMLNRGKHTCRRACKRVGRCWLLKSKQAHPPIVSSQFVAYGGEDGVVGVFRADYEPAARRRQHHMAVAGAKGCKCNMALPGLAVQWRRARVCPSGVVQRCLFITATLLQPPVCLRHVCVPRSACSRARVPQGGGWRALRWRSSRHSRCLHTVACLRARWRSARSGCRAPACQVGAAGRVAGWRQRASLACLPIAVGRVGRAFAAALRWSAAVH